MNAPTRKAVEELGLKLTPFEDCLTKAVRWYHEEGYIRKPIRVP
jgi:hypothetical protein